MVPDLRCDCRIPDCVRVQIQGCSLEAEVLDCLGFRPGDGTDGGTRFQELYEKAERLAEEALPYLFPDAPKGAKAVVRPTSYHARGEGEEDAIASFEVFLGGAAVGLFCFAAGCIAWLL